MAKWQNIRIKKGQHVSKKRFGPFWVPRVNVYDKKQELFSYSFIFTEQMAYDLKGNDQKDWCKLCGVSYGSFFQSTDYTAMVGFRYVPNKGHFELNAYYHIGDLEPDRYFTEPLATVKVGERFDVDIRVDYAGKTYTIEVTKVPDDIPADWELLFSHKQQYDHDYTRPRMISAWFGGNRTAPNTMHFWYNTYAKITYLQSAEGSIIRNRREENLN